MNIGDEVKIISCKCKNKIKPERPICIGFSGKIDRVYYENLVSIFVPIGFCFCGSGRCTFKVNELEILSEETESFEVDI